MTNTIQKRFKVSSTQLLYQSCPYQALTLFIIGPFLDGLLTNKNVFAFKYTPQVLVSDFFWLIMLLNLPIGTNISHCLINLTADLYCAVLPDICLGQLQHISCNWKDIARHLSSFGSFENLFGSGIRLCFTARSFQLEKYLWNFCSVNWDDPLFLLLLDREPAKDHRIIFSVITGTAYFDVSLVL